MVARASHPPPRPSTTLLALLLVPLLGAIPFFHMLPKPIPLIVLAANALLLAGTLIPGTRALIHAALLTFLGTAWTAIVPAPFWPTLLPPLLAYAALILALAPLRRSVDWLRTGRIDRTVLALIIAAILISSAALLAWYFLLTPDLAHFAQSIPSRNPLLLVLEGMGFALLNAAMEETIYRGVLMEALLQTLSPAWLAILLQALAFGLLHIKGIPGGPTGIALATLYGIMLGIIRRRSHGMLAPFLTHIAADAVIFAILISLV